MFDYDKWQEIFSTIRQNKLRTFLTAFSVGWGIFILIILLGAGNGLTNGTHDQFAGDAINSIWVAPGTTSMAYKGYKPGRDIALYNSDFKAIKKNIKDIDHATAVYGNREMRNMVYKKEKANFLARPVMPDHKFLENITLLDGRFINDLDIKEYRKVCAIGAPVKDALFKHENPVGKYINIDDIPYKVVGVFTDANDRDTYRAYLPVSTAQRAYNGKDKLTNMWMSTGNASLERSEQMTQELRNLLANTHSFSNQDLNALYVGNNNVEYKRIMNVLSGLKLFVWLIGIMTLIAGIVGVSNIMMIIVKERTKEIGIRKAIGASPSSIVFLIIQEAVFITAVAGYIGLLLGMGLLALVNKLKLNSDFFKNPNVDASIAITATVFIIVAGALAGLFPALRAAKIEPVVALRNS